jgi:hypothetical protein
MNEDLNPELAQRRELLRRAAWLLGGAISAPAALALLQGCSRQPPGDVKAAWVPTLLDGREVEVVTAIADIMIPKTDTSGALDAGVPAFIDSALAALYSKDDQRRFRDGIAEFGAPTVASVKQAIEAALATDHDSKPFILMIRELTLLGYFNSRVGITENMEYVSVPTAFHGCVPLSKMSKHVYWE